MRQRPPDVGPLSAKSEDHGTERHGPNDAVYKHFQRIDRTYSLEVHGQEAPHQVRGQTGDDPVTEIG